MKDLHIGPNVEDRESRFTLDEIISKISGIHPVDHRTIVSDEAEAKVKCFNYE